MTPSSLQISFTLVALPSPAQAGDLESALIGRSGVESVDVNLATGSVGIGYDPSRIDPSHLWRIITSIGYPLAAEAPSPQLSIAER